MTEKYYRLNVHLRVQPTLPQGLSFFDGPGSSGFPGVVIDAELARIIDRLNGSILLLPDVNDDPTQADEARNRIRTHFEGVVGNAGPGNSRWVPLLASAAWTIEDKIRWNPGFEALAFQLGTQSLTAIGSIDPTQPELPYVDSYSFTSRTAGSMKLWLCFGLEVA